MPESESDPSPTGDGSPVQPTEPLAAPGSSRGSLAGEDAGSGGGDRWEGSGRSLSRTRRRILAHAAAVLVAAISLNLLMPTLIGVYASLDEVGRLSPLWLLVIVGCQVASFWCMWELTRLAIHTVRLAVVARAQLIGNAAGLVVPGGAATGAAVQLRMLTVSGVNRTAAVSALPVVSLLTTGSVLASPMFALPAILGVSSVSRQLVLAVWLGAAGSALLAVTLVVLLATTRPIQLVANMAQGLHNKLLRRRPPVVDLDHRLLAERDLIRSRLGDARVGALAATVGKIGFDYLSLLAALAAVGARPDPALVLIAFVAAQALRMVPFTPGGLGFVEAGLTGTLVAAGVGSSQAVLATAAYRFASYLLPILAGAAAYVWLRIDTGRAVSHRPQP